MIKTINKIVERQVEVITELMSLLSESFITCTSADKYSVEIQTKKLVDAQEVHRLIIELTAIGEVLQKLDECKDRFCRIGESQASCTKNPLPLPCKFCKAKDPMSFFDESDSEHPAWQYLCGCGVSGPRAKEKAIALEYWNDLH
jgi:hypothetical protein